MKFSFIVENGDEAITNDVIEDWFSSFSFWDLDDLYVEQVGNDVDVEIYADYSNESHLIDASLLALAFEIEKVHKRMGMNAYVEFT